MNPQNYYDQGYALGWQLHEQGRQQSDLQNEANQGIAKASPPVPMTMQIHYRDGVSAGYKAAKENATKTPDES